MSEIGLLEVCEDLGVQLEAEKQRHAALRQRHAEAVAAAYYEGFDHAANMRATSVDEGWEWSEARKGVARDK